LDIAGFLVLGDDLRRLSKGLGPLRDLDVLLETKGIPVGLRRWAQPRRSELRSEAIALVNDVGFQGMIRALRTLPSPSAKDAKRALPGYERRVMKAARRIEGVDFPTVRDGSAPLDLAELLKAPAVTLGHALRRRLRKLRFAREWAGRGTRELVKAQDGFGVLSDQTLLARCALLWKADGGEVPSGFQASVRRKMMEALGPARDRWREVEATVLGKGQPGD
jgi:CHAD domain-containing protein